MMHESQILVKNITQKLIEALQEIPLVHAQLLVQQKIRPLSIDKKLDATIDLEISGRKYVLFTAIKRAVFPRDVREILWTLNKYTDLERPAYQNNIIIPLLAAESISSGAKELLKSEQVGYYDTGGSLFVPEQGIYIYIEKPPPKTLSKSVTSIFKGKRSQVLHTLLQKYNEWFGVNELAKIAKVSPATASETLTALDRFEWVTTKGQGPSKERRLSEPGALLDEWRKQILATSRKLSYRRYYIPSTNPKELSERLDELCQIFQVEYVLTQEAAAQLFSPFLSNISRITCRMAPSKEAVEVIAELGARVVNEGANLDVIETRSQGEFLFKERLGSVWAASPIQVYLDLLQSGGRAKEMAEHLRQDRVGF